MLGAGCRIRRHDEVQGQSRSRHLCTGRSRRWPVLPQRGTGADKSRVAAGQNRHHGHPRRRHVLRRDQPARNTTTIEGLAQEDLAQMVGTTRARISYFMNEFRNLGYIDYNGNISVRRSLSNVRVPESAVRKTLSTPCDGNHRQVGKRFRVAFRRAVKPLTQTYKQIINNGPVCQYVRRFRRSCATLNSGLAVVVSGLRLTDLARGSLALRTKNLREAPCPRWAQEECPARGSASGKVACASL